MLFSNIPVVSLKLYLVKFAIHLLGRMPQRTLVGHTYPVEEGVGKRGGSGGWTQRSFKISHDLINRE